MFLIWLNKVCFIFINQAICSVRYFSTNLSAFGLLNAKEAFSAFSLIDLYNSGLVEISKMKSAACFNSTFVKHCACLKALLYIFNWLSFAAIYSEGIP